MTTATATPPPPTDTDPNASNGDTPPAEEGGTRTRKRRSDAGVPRGPRRAPKRATAIANKLKSAANFAAAIVSARDMFSGKVIEHNAEKLANAWAPIIASNPRLVQIMGQLEKGGNLGAAIAVTIATVLPIVAYHKPEIFPNPAFRGLALGMAPAEAQAMARARDMQRAQASAGDAPSFTTGGYGDQS